MAAVCSVAGGGPQQAILEAGKRSLDAGGAPMVRDDVLLPLLLQPTSAGHNYSQDAAVGTAH